MTRPLYPHPSGWSVATLEPNLEQGVVTKSASGSTPPTEEEDSWGGTFPWLTPKEVTGASTNRRIGLTERTLTAKGVAKAGGLCPPNTVLLTKRAPVGVTVISAVSLAINQGFLGFTCGDRLDQEFFYYWLRANRAYLDAVANGSTYPELYVGDLFELEIAFPDLGSQRQIVSVLRALDNKIELNRRMNVTLEAMARVLYQSWFVDFDPVRAKLDARPPAGLDPATAALFPASLQDSPLGKIPSGWWATPLYDAARWVNGAAFRTEDFCAAGEGLPVIKIGELKDGITMQTKWSQRQATPNQVIDTGDLLYSWSGSPDTSLEAFLWSGGPGLLNQHIFKVIAPTAAKRRFVYYLLQHLRPVLVETARNKQTTGLGHVTVDDMKRLLVCLPSKEVLVAFDRSVAAIFDRAFTNTLESRTLAVLRDTLLPKLLNGELRLAA